MQRQQRKAGWQREMNSWKPGSQRGLVWVGRHAPGVAAVFVEFPASRPLTHPRLNLLNSVRVYSFPIRSQRLLLISAAMNYSQLY